MLQSFLDQLAAGRLIVPIDYVYGLNEIRTATPTWKPATPPASSSYSFSANTHREKFGLSLFPCKESKPPLAGVGGSTQTKCSLQRS